MLWVCAMHVGSGSMIVLYLYLCQPLVCRCAARSDKRLSYSSAFVTVLLLLLLQKATFTGCTSDDVGDSSNTGSLVRILL